MSRTLFDRIIGGGWAAVEALRGEHEGPNLEAKLKHDRSTPVLGPAPEPPRGKAPRPDDRANIAKAICGLANADGGLFLFGVRAQPNDDGVDRITNIEPIMDVEACARRVDDVIARAIEPLVSVYELRPITQPGGTSGVVAVYVAPSDGGPHRDESGRHYLRAGARTELMPHTILGIGLDAGPTPASGSSRSS